METLRRVDLEGEESIFGDVLLVNDDRMGWVDLMVVSYPSSLRRIIVQPATRTKIW